jgi:Transposase DDE domain group 1
MESVLRLVADHQPSRRHRTLTIKEGKYALKWTRLSCRRFRDNQARLPLFALAYNPPRNFLRQMALPRPVQTWTLTTPREKLIKIGAKVVHHAKVVTFQLPEVAVPRASG